MRLLSDLMEQQTEISYKMKPHTSVHHICRLFYTSAKTCVNLAIEFLMEYKVLSRNKKLNKNWICLRNMFFTMQSNTQQHIAFKETDLKSNNIIGSLAKAKHHSGLQESSSMILRYGSSIKCYQLLELRIQFSSLLIEHTSYKEIHSYTWACS